MKSMVKYLGIVLLVSVALPIYAESAPVYDADAMQQQFENAGDQGQELPAPPAPAPEQEGAFVPVQQSQQVPQAQPAMQNSSTASLTPDQRLRRLEQQVNNMQSSDTSARVDSLQNQVQTLRGQLEQLTHQLEQLQSQQKSQYADLDKRLSQQAAANQATDAAPNSAVKETKVDKTNAKTAKQLIKTPPTTEDTTAADDVSTLASNTHASNTRAQSSDQPNVAEEQQIYQTAYNLIKAKKYNDAVEALQKMLQKYPSGQFASNAHYWLGELYGLMGKNDQALIEFSTVVKNYRDSPRVSDAQLKVGLIYAAESNWSEAKTSFKKVINHYPGTASARLAAEQLKQIKQAGH